METLMSEALLMSQPQTCTVTPNVISLQASEANHPPQHPDDMKLQLTKKWFESRLAQEDGMEIGAGVSAIHLYAVTAYRYGMRDDHSYVVGIYSTLDLAKSAADSEVEYRGGKYGCAVVEMPLDLPNESDLGKQVYYIESPYFGLLGTGHQAADNGSDEEAKSKRIDALMWYWEEMRLPVMLRRIICKISRLLRFQKP